jgi:hypothetical protein
MLTPAPHLPQRFPSVYDAFAFFDINGDWHVTPVSFAPPRPARRGAR